MKLCVKKHTPLAYEEYAFNKGECPCCMFFAQVIALKSEIRRRDYKIDNLSQKLKKLKEELTKLKEMN